MTSSSPHSHAKYQRSGCGEGVSSSALRSPAESIGPAHLAASGMGGARSSLMVQGPGPLSPSISPSPWPLTLWYAGLNPLSSKRPGAAVGGHRKFAAGVERHAAGFLPLLGREMRQLCLLMCRWRWSERVKLL
ncbi:hypothetical protein EYF80_007892 [Liparis tanakae]|uniref:Uncharacterized protein n=1 Tax=Liparis tanakae TaxID=230148 RepID=A0A4Z2IWX4_9TELE|nr:hypothetical protein EYF80_007892 [Liparis tanakae]